MKNGEKTKKQKVGLIDNMSMQRKLFTLAGVILILTFLMGAMSVWAFTSINSVANETATNSAQLLEYADEMEANYNTMRTGIYRALAFGAIGNMEQKKTSLENVAIGTEGFKENGKNYVALVKELYPEDSKEYQDAVLLEQNATAYIKFFNKIVEDTENGIYGQTLIYIGMQKDVVDNCVTSVKQAKADAKAVLFGGLDNINHRSTNSTYFVITIFVLVILLGITVAMYMARKISVSMAKLLENVEHLQSGEFAEITNSNAKDEIGVITRSLVEVAEIVESVVNDVEDIDGRYNDGSLCPQMDAEKYKGGYNSLAKAVNHVFRTNDEKFEYIITVVEKLASGDFNIDKKQFPGEQAVVTNALFTCLDNILALNVEINNIIDNVAIGNVLKNDRYPGIKVDSERFDGEWKQIVEGIENIVVEFVNPLNALFVVFDSMSKGDLSARMEGQYVGQLKELQELAENCNSVIQSYITEIEFILSQLAHNKYNVTIEREYIGDFTVIRRSLLDIIEQLNNVMGEISDSSSVIANSAAASAETSVSLAEASTRQNQAITMLLQEIDNVIAVTKTNAQSANEARNLSHKTLENAESGNKQMEQMLTTINEISDASRSIGNIIGIIEDIAFQTNLLALNAAVEAARAGEHGKGFAVVAEEVRSLAGRSQKAALETKELINQSIEKVTEGTEKADSTSNALDAILRDITQVSELIENIAGASETQATTITGFGNQVNDISDVANMNTSTSEESAAIAQEISAQSETLRNIVSGFELKYDLD